MQIRLISRTVVSSKFGALLIILATGILAIAPLHATTNIGQATSQASKETGLVMDEMALNKMNSSNEDQFSSEKEQELSSQSGSVENYRDLLRRFKSLKAKALLNIDPEILESLDLQLDQILALRDSEEAFSDTLGETYYSYAETLKASGQISEAKKMYSNALHINKINNGVNHLEQKTILQTMAELNLMEGDLDAAGKQISRINWLEKRHDADIDI